MPIVDTRTPITAQRCNDMILQLVEAYPFCRTEVLSRTAFQRPLRTLVIGTGPRKVIYSASHHANEWITSLVLLKFAEELAAAIQNGGSIFDRSAQEISDAATIYMVPMVDPDGVDLVTGAIEPGSREYLRAREIADRFPDIPFPDGWKANLNGVDLNLSYPAGWEQARQIKFAQGFDRPAPRDYVGTAPLTQPEARALAELTLAVDPDLVLAYHTQGQVIYYQFQDYEVPGATELAERFAAVSGYSVEDTPFNSSFAGYKDWFIQEFRRPGFTIEVGLGQNPLPIEQFDEIYADNLGILVTGITG